MTESQLRTLIEIIERRSTNRESTCHGPQHWRCVAKLGIHLARATPGGDADIALLFGLFHDTMRENDWDDPWHGMRASEFMRELALEGIVPIDEERLQICLYACETHTEAPPTELMPVGVCYDADRLNLWRVGITPNETYLSTVAGKELIWSHLVRDMHDIPLTWNDVLQFYFADDADLL